MTASILGVVCLLEIVGSAGDFEKSGMWTWYLMRSRLNYAIILRVKHESDCQREIGSRPSAVRCGSVARGLLYLL